MPYLLFEDVLLVIESDTIVR